MEVIVSGTSKQVIQEKTKGCVYATTEVWESGIASIHLDVRSMIVKMWLQPLLYCAGGCGGGSGPVGSAGRILPSW